MIKLVVSPVPMSKLPPGVGGIASMFVNTRAFTNNPVMSFSRFQSSTTCYSYPVSSIRLGRINAKTISFPMTSWMQQPVKNLHRCQHHLAEGKGGKGPLDATTVPQPVPVKKHSFLKFISSRFLKFLDHYQKILEKKFPGAMNVYRVFVVGFKDFTVETKDYMMLKSRVITGTTELTELSRKEIEIYYRLPGEILRVGPTLLISALPFANYIVFPIAYYFPKKLLSSHFWSLQQKSQFALEFHKQKLVNYRPLFRHLQLNVADVLDKDRKVVLQDALHQLGCGAHPTVDEILQFKTLFESDRYSLQAIFGPHVKALCRAHGMHCHYFNRRRLGDRAEMLRAIDSVLARDGTENLKLEELKTACFLRGLNASNLDSVELRKYLDNWLAVSQALGPSTNSLLLHLPIFLAYNHPNNWGLLKA